MIFLSSRSQASKKIISEMDPSPSRNGFWFWITIILLLWLNVNVHAFQTSDWSDKIFGTRPSSSTPRSVFLASTPRHFPSSSSSSSSSSLFSSSSMFPSSARNSFWPQSPINSMNAFQSFQTPSTTGIGTTINNNNNNNNHNLNNFQRHYYSSRFPPLPQPFMKSRIPLHHFLTNFQQQQPTEPSPPPPPPMMMLRTTPAPFDWVKELIQNRLIESRNNLNQVQESLQKIQPIVAASPTTTTSTSTTTTSTTRRPFKLGQYQVVMDHVPPRKSDPESMIQNHIERLDQIQNNNSNNNNNNNNENRIDVDYADQIPEIKDENLDYYDQNVLHSKKEPINSKVLFADSTDQSSKSGQGSESKIKEQKLVKMQRSNQSWIQDSFANLAKEIENEMDRSKVKEEEMDQLEIEDRRPPPNLDRRSHNLEFEDQFLQSLDEDDSNYNSNSNSTWSFRCPDNRTGFYADLSDDCQSYYHCSGHRRERFRFTCPYGTKFNERSSNCDWEDNVDCHQKFDLLRA